ncbi:MAG TPA: ABC transporter substrate-binding protein [Ideonella sp.]|nr:ABC transporter substrate-binding protein [Ideonella sp.]
MKRTKVVALAALVATALAQPASAATIKISCGAVGQELLLCQRNAEAWAKKTGNEVQVVATPNDASERLALFQQVLSAGSDKIDVFQVDVVWPGLLAAHLLDLKPYAHGIEAEHFPGFIGNNTVGGRLVALPWFVNAGLLFYRKDLLDKYRQGVPSTWEELSASARRIQDGERNAGNERMWGYVWQGRAYEGLTCNALEWVASHGGGSIVEPDGHISINNPQAAAALRQAAGWVGSITPTAVLNYGEEESRGVFQAGNAVFMRNWPYAWSLAQGEGSVIKGKIGVAPLPAGPGGPHVATLGGESLAVSKYSRQPALAADLVLYMTSAAVQKARALEGSFNPSRPLLYQDAEVLKANPFMGELVESFAHAVARPTAATGTHYNRVSNEFWNTTHDVLAGRLKPDAGVARLEATLKRASRGEQWH